MLLTYDFYPLEAFANGLRKDGMRYDYEDKVIPGAKNC